MSRIVTILRRLGLPSRRLAKGERGAAAIEFALILPIMLTLLIAIVDLNRLLVAYRKTGGATFTVADLITQTRRTASDGFVSLDSNSLNLICNAAREVVRPLNPATFAAGVQSVTCARPQNYSGDLECREPAHFDDTGTYICACTGGLGDCPETFSTIGWSQMDFSNLGTVEQDSLIVVYGYYRYKPIFTLVFDGSFDLESRHLMRVRNVNGLILPGGSSPGGVAEDPGIP